ncbi:MAG: nuclear transport factor 2 family protein [Hymenobacter sp.]
MQALLADPTNLELVRSLTSPDITYVSLNYDNPELKKVMPWCGTGYGPEVIVKTFQQVGESWKKQEFDIREIFGSGENVAVFGSMTYQSVQLGKAITSPFAMLAKVRDGKVRYLQFMEDTFGTASSFRTGVAPGISRACPAPGNSRG